MIATRSDRFRPPSPRRKTEISTRLRPGAASPPPADQPHGAVNDIAVKAILNARIQDFCGIGIPSVALHVAVTVLERRSFRVAVGVSRRQIESIQNLGLLHQIIRH